MSTRATTARHVRQRKLNTKQPLRIIREHEIEDGPEDESQRHIPQVETGVEKGEEVEFHLQAAINAANATALGAKSSKQNYIPTPDVEQAKSIKYDDLYPKVFSNPATYIRFSSTVEDCNQVPYCMDDSDVECLAKLNDGKNASGHPRKDKLSQCSEDLFEEVMSFFTETSARLQPFASLDNAPILSFEEMKRSVDESMSKEAQRWMKHIYQYWVMKKGSSTLMPAIKVRTLEASSEADDADPYVCFRRREVRQTRKTRGRDAQVVEKLKKLRLELEQGRSLLQMVAQREQLNREDLEVSRNVFEQRRKLREVKVQKGIVGEKGEDEELLVNQKPTARTKGNREGGQPRPPTIRLRSIGSNQIPDNDLVQLSDIQAEADAQVQHTVHSRREQHKRWNQQWIDETWRPITPPLDGPEEPLQWAPLLQPSDAYPTPPPTLPSENSQERDADVEMQDGPIIKQEGVVAGSISGPDGEAVAEQVAERAADLITAPAAPPTPPRELTTLFHLPISPDPPIDRASNPACRLRYGRGGRRFLEARRPRARPCASSGVVSDSDSDDEDGGAAANYFAVDPRKIFDYRCNVNTRVRPDNAGGERKSWPVGGEQQAQQAHWQQQQQQQQQVAAGGGGSG